MKSRLNRAVWGCLAAATILTGGTAGFSAPASPLTQLAWETDYKELVPKENDLTAEFTFGLTNISDSEVVIDHVTATCSCTVAKLPSQPWHLTPGTNTHLGVTVDLRGKMGQFEKTLSVFFADKDAPPKLLKVSVKMPGRKLSREKNMQILAADRQAVFKGDCAKCHAEPAKTNSGMALYHEVCGICHEAKPRASVVPDLRLLPHPTDYTFWKTMIASGKPGTLMPAFAKSQGGPLTDGQVDDLAKSLEDAYPYSRFGGHPPEPMPARPPGPDEPVFKPAPPAAKN